MKVAAIFLSAFVAATLGVPLGHVIHEARDETSTVLKRLAAPAANTVVPVRIALKQRNLENGMQHLLDVSDPDSNNYGKFYSQDRVAEMFAPSQESIDTVTDWLVKSGIPADEIHAGKSKGWLDLRTTVSKLESLLKTDYSLYSHPESGTEHIGAESYVLPSAVSRHVDFISPAVVMTQIQKTQIQNRSSEPFPRVVPFEPYENQQSASLASSSAALDDCAGHMTPACIKALYNISDATLSNPNNKLGIFESGDEMHTQADLDMFYGTYAPNIPKGFGPEIHLIDYLLTKPDPKNAVGEAALDFDVAIPIVYPQGTVLYQTHSNFNGILTKGFLNQFLDAVDGSYCTKDGGDDLLTDGITLFEECGTLKPASVISFSYGLTEAAWPTSYLRRQCDEFMKLGLQGTSLVFASGDGGVAGGHGKDCKGANGDIFNPAAPGSCPYVTSVGATLLPMGSHIGDPESATIRFGSGGGFSNIWTAPVYQADALAGYFANHDPGFSSYNTSENNVPSNGGIYNRIGRGFPDVSSVGDYGVIAFKGKFGRIGGTSMSAPIFAAILNRINEERLNAGKNVIGFANPAMYKNPAAFRDVTLGAQTGDSACNGKGFSAVEGWDPVTGLGTPKYPELLKYFMGLP